MAKTKINLPLTVDKRSDGVAVIHFNDPDDKVNKLSTKLVGEFGKILDDLQADANVKALVWISDKEGCFIAGADIDEFLGVKKPEDAEKISKAAQDIFDRIEKFPKPNVAAIHGVALGGGCEFALACHYRIATDHPSTYLGLPEVKLGLLPGGGGTQRLPKLIDLQNAMDMMLTGKNIYPKKARKIGLVDEVVMHWGLADTAATAALRLVENGAARHKTGKLADRVFKEVGPARDFALKKAEEMVQKKSRGNYPAPLKIIAAVKAGLVGPRDAGFAAERKLFGELAVSPQSRQLVNLFFGMTAKKKPPLAKGAKPSKRVGVLGAGLMGAGIGLVTTNNAKLPVVIKDIADEALAKGAAYIRKDLERKVKKGGMKLLDRDKALSRVLTTRDYSEMAHCDIVIEAVFEEIKIKQAVLKDVEKVTAKDCVFASNTSALPISEIAKASKRPETVLGMHYFSPVEKMPLLEVIRTDKTAAWATKKAVALGVKQGKTVIVVKDGPGFYTTRILAPYLNETCMLLEEGVRIEAIDRALMDFGFPVGPVRLIDEVGMDVAAHVGDFLGAFFRKTRGEIPQSEALARLSKAGFAGRKNQKGFYDYTGGKKVKPGKTPNEEIYGLIEAAASKTVSPGDIADRIALVMVNEAAHCLQEGIIESPLDGDLGAILGLGFPPFLGGPFRYIDSVGAAKIVESLKKLADAHGPQFAPAKIIDDCAKKGKTLY